MGAKENYEAKKRQEKARQEQKKPWYKQPSPIDRFTGWLVVWTALLFIGTVGSAVILYKTHQTVRETFVANERPWIQIDVKPTSDFLYVEGRASVQLQFSLTNIGKTPAVYALFDAKMYIDDPRLGAGDIRAYQREVCEKSASSVDIGLGYMIFPKTAFKRTLFVSVEKKEVDAYLRARERLKDKGIMYYIDPVVVACVNYRFTVGSAEAHRTAILVHIVREPPSMVGFEGSIDLLRAPIPRSELRIGRSFSFFGEYAN